MKMKLEVGKFGTSSRMKVLALLTLCAVCAMAWTFVTVGKRAELSQSRLANVGEQLVLSQQVAKFALAATTGNTEAFASMEKSRNGFTRILDQQMNRAEGFTRQSRAGQPG
jgi:hypothetical protein